MSYNFSANQYEGAFKPHNLGNYQTPKWFPKHPTTLCKATRIIGNDRGHQLPCKYIITDKIYHLFR